MVGVSASRRLRMDQRRAQEVVGDVSEVGGVRVGEHSALPAPAGLRLAVAPARRVRSVVVEASRFDVVHLFKEPVNVSPDRSGAVTAVLFARNLRITVLGSCVGKKSGGLLVTRLASLEQDA